MLAVLIFLSQLLTDPAGERSARPARTNAADRPGSDQSHAAGDKRVTGPSCAVSRHPARHPHVPNCSRSSVARGAGPACTDRAGRVRQHHGGPRLHAPSPGRACAANCLPLLPRGIPPPVVRRLSLAPWPGPKRSSAGTRCGGSDQPQLLGGGRWRSDRAGGETRMAITMRTRRRDN